MPERIVARGIGDVDARPLQQHDIVETDLQASQRLGIRDGVERAVGQHREIGRHVVEHARIDIDPDAEHAVLAKASRDSAAGRSP